MVAGVSRGWRGTLLAERRIRFLGPVGAGAARASYELIWRWTTLPALVWGISNPVATQGHVCQGVCHCVCVCVVLERMIMARYGKEALKRPHDGPVWQGLIWKRGYAELTVDLAYVFLYICLPSQLLNVAIAE